jgi:hypothetical protein
MILLGINNMWAFSNEVRFSCKNLTNQNSQSSRLNWISLGNARSELGTLTRGEVDRLIGELSNLS